jgi:hypothetical protein
MDQERSQSQGQSGQQPSKQAWDGRERRMGTPDRRQQQSGDQRQPRNTSADIQMMNEGSSR